MEINSPEAIARVAVKKREAVSQSGRPLLAGHGMARTSRDGLLVFGMFSTFVFLWGLACLIGAMLGGGLIDLARNWFGSVLGM